MRRHLLNILFILLPPASLFWIRSILLRMANIKVASNVSFCGGGWIYGRGNLSIGSCSWLSPRCFFYTHVDAPIFIGDSCDIGPNVSFITGGHLFGDSERRAGKGFAKSIFVEDGCWIGAGSLILGGARIGRGSVVAAGSVVIGDIPSNTLFAGVPARYKRKLDQDLHD